MNKAYYTSPIGILEIICEKLSIVSVKLTDKIEQQEVITDVLKNTISQLDEYFLRKRTSFDIPINLQGTEFQKKVWKELVKIPYGKTLSYAKIAEKISSKSASRAIGNACNKNPIMIIIPCHRVISKSGKLSGFAYGTKAKEKLLQIEKN